MVLNEARQVQNIGLSKRLFHLVQLVGTYCVNISSLRLNPHHIYLLVVLHVLVLAVEEILQETLVFTVYEWIIFLLLHSLLCVGEVKLHVDSLEFVWQLAHLDVFSSFPS